MLSNISWYEYFTACGVLLILYYLFVPFVFYNKELGRLINGKGSATAKASPLSPVTSNLMGAIQENETGLPEKTPHQPETFSNRSLEFTDENISYPEYEHEAAVSETFDELERLSVRLQSVMESYGKKGNRIELTEKLRREVVAFSAGRDMANFKEAINLFIKEQCIEICHTRMEPADIKAIWSREMR